MDITAQHNLICIVRRSLNRLHTPNTLRGVDITNLPFERMSIIHKDHYRCSFSPPPPRERSATRLRPIYGCDCYTDACSRYCAYDNVRTLVMFLEGCGSHNNFMLVVGITTFINTPNATSSRIVTSHEHTRHSVYIHEYTHTIRRRTHMDKHRHTNTHTHKEQFKQRARSRKLRLLHTFCS